MTETLSTVYNPNSIEQLSSQIWNDGNYFHTAPPSKNGKDAAPYTIVIPPPNVTGVLHLGHAIDNTLQDILIRYRRMQGFNTLWVPGTDHAGIATQSVVEKRLRAETGQTRHDVGRDKIVEMIWDWKKLNGDKILEQLKRIGASCDWDRTRFTLDDMCAKAVRHTFVNLFKKGLIYRGKRLVNWDSTLQTAVSDDEVVHKTVQGNFWYIHYPMADGSGNITVATTRPETMLGDTAIAINPKDERAEQLLGKKVKLPLTDREITIIADDHVKLGEGTGTLKVTPAHDPNDYEIGLRHDLEMINILTPDGKINENGGKYAGLDRFAARKAVVKDLETEGLLEKVEPREQQVGHSDRSGDVIEPYLSDQWFVKVKPLAKEAIKAVEDGKIKFHPARFGKSYLDWLYGIRDWCISRQLWWGHRIPIWYIRLEPNFIGLPDKNKQNEIQQEFKEKFNKLSEAAGLGKNFVYQFNPGNFAEVYVCPLSEKATQLIIDFKEFFESLELEEVKPGQSTPIAQSTLTNFPNATHAAFDLSCSSDSLCNIYNIQQDPDVLDTWFSSALWPHSTLGWPEKTDELEFYYPTSTLVTARDIITLWVSRMVMMGLENMNEVPFSNVFIHPTILDGKGERMSKSKGNGIDPIEIIDTYGADAMRFSLSQMTTESQDVRLPVTKDKEGRNLSEKFDIGRNFCNKLWNASRFAMMNLDSIDSAAFDAKQMDITDKWILSKLAETAKDTTQMLDDFKFSEPLMAVYRFFWNDVCDWYLEWLKPRMADEQQKKTAQNVLAFVLDNTLRLLHPFIPFITEGIFQKLNEISPNRSLAGIKEFDSAEALIIAQWPDGLDELIDPEIEDEIADVQEVVKAIREIRNKYTVAPKTKLQATANAPADITEILNKNAALICNRAGLSSFAASADAEKPKTAAAAIVEQIQVFVHDTIDSEAEKKRLEKQKEELLKAIKSNENKLANENFVTRAKPEVVEQTKERLEEFKQQLAVVEENLTEL